eukprot:1920328-Rhodomonas_salina.2
MCGTHSIGYAAADIIAYAAADTTMIGYAATDSIRYAATDSMRYAATDSMRYAATRHWTLALELLFSLSGTSTDVAYVLSCLPACYAMPGTDIASE